MIDIKILAAILCSLLVACACNPEAKEKEILPPPSPALQTSKEKPTMPNEKTPTKYNALSAEEQRVILHAGTERGGTGEYNTHYEEGVYICRQCNAQLYTSSAKFKSGCGWPSYDEGFKNSVEQRTDIGGSRTEILCRNCKGHLGHVFLGEGFTDKNTRHCVNSLSIRFIAANKEIPAVISLTKTAIFASGCFWGTEYFMQQIKGVISTRSGYIGGHVKNPTYQQVCEKNTGHLEAVEVTYDSSQVSYAELCRTFFETHDPAQDNGQGPDIGPQYLSAVFTSDAKEKAIVEAYFDLLSKKGIIAATKILPSAEFYEAELYHQDYYKNNGKIPYCHAYKKKFSEQELKQIRDIHK